MTTTDTITHDLADFGSRERRIAADILRALDRDGLPPTMYNDGLRIYLNRDSGFVFLCDSDYNTAVMDGPNLAGHYSSPYEGHEGTFAELAEMYDPDTWNADDTEWLYDIAEALGRTDELPDTDEQEDDDDDD
jgi:hypothetical protein